MQMKSLGVVISVLALVYVTTLVRAEPRDSVDRGSRLDRDAIRDDVRIDRLKVPRHPLSAEQPSMQPEPVAAPKAKSKKARKVGDVH
jgi:hypothetical protein